jgi:5-methylcytosine-specific restriction endonuclease McrA
MAYNPRYKNGNARRRLRARVKAEGRACGICGKPIDYTLPAGHPMSYELDEIIPISLGGSPIEYNNVQPAHRRCNQLKSNKIIRQGQIIDKKNQPQNQPKNKQVNLEQTKALGRW